MIGGIISMSGYCSVCRNTAYCICDNPADHPEIRNSKKMLRNKATLNNEKYKVKRFGIMSNSHDSWFVENDNGEYVKYSDYEKLLNKLNEI
jgi:hypothetical protein